MILVLNCGSQSVKWKLFNDKLVSIKEGKKEVFNFSEYEETLKEEISKLSIYKNDIKVVGHRVVHGGKNLRKPIKISKNVLREIKKFDKLAPLHNPYNLLGIKIGREIFPKVSHIAVFDTGFYVNLPEKACIYPLPEKINKKYGIRRFGFHGISHEYASKEGARRIKKLFNELKIISCHLGGGSSITAIKNGKAIDTSMGFTPMEGLAMMILLFSLQRASSDLPQRV